MKKKKHKEGNSYGISELCLLVVYVGRSIWDRHTDNYARPLRFLYFI